MSNHHISIRRTGALLLALVALLAFSAPTADAELGGDCKLKAPGFGNPGLGCNGVGDACTINGNAGKCTNMKRRISSLIYCVCSPDGKKVPEEVEATAVADTALEPGCGQTATFHIDESLPHIVDIAFKEIEEVVRLESFSGSFTVTTSPLAEDADARTESGEVVATPASRCAISIENGEFVAPAFVLPDGRDTGVNVYTFGPANGSAGVLDLTTGKYTAATSGLISNALYPGLPTEGTYRGTVDFADGTITIDTTTIDRVDLVEPDAEPFPEPAPTPTSTDDLGDAE